MENLESVRLTPAKLWIPKIMAKSIHRKLLSKANFKVLCGWNFFEIVCTENWRAHMLKHKNLLTGLQNLFTPRTEVRWFGVESGNLPHKMKLLVQNFDFGFEFQKIPRSKIETYHGSFHMEDSKNTRSKIETSHGQLFFKILVPEIPTTHPLQLKLLMENCRFGFV